MQTDILEAKLLGGAAETEKDGDGRCGRLHASGYL